MKLALVFGLVAVALAAHSQWEQRPENIRERAFRAGKHYTYNFDGQISTGLPQSSTSQHSSTRVQSIVSLFFEDDRTVLMRLEKTRVGSAHRDLVDARDVKPFGLFEETHLTEEQKEQLTLPVRFRYEHGLVSELEFDDADFAWSENVKRSVLNMLQLNIAKQSRTDEVETARVLRGELPETAGKDDQDFFTAKEMTIEGDCEMAYTIVPEPEEDRIRVSKSTNFEKCGQRVDIRYNFRFGERCPSCEQKFVGEEQNTESATVLNYKLSGNQEEFLIREVELKSHYLFSPLNKEQQMIGSVVANKLVLVKVDEEKPVPQPKSSKKQKLAYSTEWEEQLEKFRMTGEESLLKESPFPWMTKKMEIARQIVEQLKREVLDELKTKDGVTYQPEANHQIARLVEVLRVATKEEIRKIEKEMTENQQLRALFYESLAIAGTKNTIEHIVEKIVQKEIVPYKAAYLIKMLINVRNPSEKIVDTLLRLAKEEVCEKNPILKQSVYLTVGALLNGLCGVQRDRMAMEVSFEHNKQVCPRQMKEKYVETLESLYRKAETRYEKILAIKTIANSGMDLVVFPLEKIIVDVREEKAVRLQAIDALRQLRFVMPRKLQNILMPLFKNIREYPEIRVAAFHQIMQLVPERVVIDQITEQLAKEPSHQVHVFVYTALQSFAKSDIPCEKDMARDIETSLKLARVQPRKYLDSHLYRSTLYSEEYLTGASLNWATLFANDSVLPKEVMASLETVFAGDWNKYLAQVGFAQQNIDQLLYKLLEKMEESEMALEDVIIRGKRSAGPKPSELLKKMMQKMNIKQRRYSEDKAHAMVYLRYKDLDYAVIPMDEEICAKLFKTLIKTGKLDISEVERVLAKGYSFNVDLASFIYEKTRMIPTTLGLPLEIVGKLPTVATIEGEIKVELEPKNGKRIEGAKLRLVAQPKLASTHVTHMEIRSPIVSTGVKLLHSIFVNLPIDMQLELNWEKKFETKLIVKAPESEQEQKMLVIHTRPVTYIRHENNEQKFARALEKTIFIAEEPVVEIQKEYGEKITGLRFNVRGNVHRHLIEKMQRSQVLPLFICENHIEITMEKTPEAPREYIFKTATTADEDKMIAEEPEEFSRFHENKEDEQLFEVEDSEYLNEEEQERRGEFARYVKDYKKGSSKAAYKLRTVMSVEAVGSRTERRAQMEIKTVCDEELKYCKLYLDATRSPVLEGERRQWQITATVQTLFPEPIMSLKQLHEQKHREAHAIVEAKWGAEEKSTLKIKVQAEQSKEQQKWQRLTIRKAEEKERETLDTVEKLELAARLNQIKMVVEYDMRPECLVQVSRISSLLKAWNPLSSTIIPRSLERTYEKTGRLTAQLSVEPQTWRYANLTIVSPSEKLILENVRLPFRPTFLSIEKTQPIRSFSQVTRRLSEQPTCEVSSSKVNTFDEVVFRAPLTTCYSVLAKDCTEEPAFAVLMKHIKKSGEEKKLKIVTEKATIEMEMTRSEEIEIKIDGKIVKDEEKLASYGVEKRGVIVVFENDDIYVRFDGYKAEIKLNEYYKNQQCGICGHYDGEYEGEFRRADDEETDDLESFHRSFLSTHEECEMEEEKLSKKENYKRFEQSEESNEESSSSEESYEYTRKDKKDRKYESEEETVEPEEKTRVIEYSSRVCFSMQPVPECPRKTFEGETEEKKVKFACLERSSSEARRLLREARNSVVSVSHLPHSFVEPLTVPKTCTVY